MISERGGVSSSSLAFKGTCTKTAHIKVCYGLFIKTLKNHNNLWKYGHLMTPLKKTCADPFYMVVHLNVYIQMVHNAEYLCLKETWGKTTPNRATEASITDTPSGSGPGTASTAGMRR